MKRTSDKPIYPESCYRAVFGETGYLSLPSDAEDTLDYVLETLTQREADMFMLKFRDEMTYAEIGEIYGLTRERIRQLLVKVERKMRHPSRSKILQMGREAYLNAVVAENEEKKRLYIERITALEGLIQTQDAEIAEYRDKLYSLDKQCMSIEVLDLSVRAWNCLTRAGITTIKDILDFEDLRKVRNLGWKCIQEIQGKLKAFGIISEDAKWYS